MQVSMHIVGFCKKKIHFVCLLRLLDAFPYNVTSFNSISCIAFLKINQEKKLKLKNSESEYKIKRKNKINRR